MQIRKIMMSMGVITLVACPVVVTISCGKKKIISSPDQSIKIDNFKPLDFNIFKQIGKDEPIFFGGINSTAYTQGMSLLFNITKGMGWNWEDANKIKKLYDASFDFKSINIATNPESGFVTSHQASRFEIYLQNALEEDYTRGLSQFIERNKDPDNLLVSRLYNQIRSLDYLDESGGDKILNADASTKVEVQLGHDFTSLSSNKKKLQRIANKLNNQRIVAQIFQNKQYAYSWSGTVLNKLGFQIQGSKLVLWHMSGGLHNMVQKIDSIRKMNNDLHLLIQDDELIPQDQKNLSQVVLDPLGADGTMHPKMLFTNLNFKNTGDSTSRYIYFDMKHFYHGGGKFNWTKKPNQKLTNFQHVTTFNSFINAEHPGSVVLKMFEGSSSALQPIINNIKKTKIGYPLQTFYTKNRLQTFYKVTSASKKKDLVNLLFSFIKFIRKQVEDETQEIKIIKKRMSPVVGSFFEFIKNNEITKNDVKTQFDKYNNGSHYMLAVEIFLRGMINIPGKFDTNYDVPPAVKLWIGLQLKTHQRKKNEIIGMSNTNNLIAMAYMMYAANKKADPPPKTQLKHYHFDPATLDFATPTKAQSHTDRFLMDLRSQKRVGRETPSYKL